MKRCWCRAYSKGKVKMRMFGCEILRGIDFKARFLVNTSPETYKVSPGRPPGIFFQLHVMPNVNIIAILHVWIDVVCCTQQDRD